MSSKRLKRLVEPDSLPDVQPVSDSDDLSSPECLLSLQPVEDDYFSDDEARKKEEEKKSSSPYYSTTYNGSNVSVKTLKKYFDLLFHSIDQNSAPDLTNLDISEILDNFNFFLTNRKDLEGNQMMAMVMSLLKKKESLVSILVENTDFHVNLKERIPNLTFDMEESSTNYQIICHFMRDLIEVLKVTRQTRPLDSGHHHNVVKMCVTSLCQMTGLRVLRNGSTATLMTATKVSSSSTSYSTRSKDKDGSEDVVSFKSYPDLVLTGSKSPSIPFEVYSPIKKKRVARKNKQKGRSMSSTSSTTVLTDEESEKSLGKFLSENIPIYKGQDSQASAACENTFKSKLVSQHVLQVIGAAAKYCYKKYNNKMQMEKEKVFIGLFVCNEYVYITKVMGDEKCFVKYLTTANFDDDDEEPEELYRSLLGPDPNPKIHVQFSPMMLDLTIHNHRMALLIFLHYYMHKWDEIKTNPITKTD